MLTAGNMIYHRYFTCSLTPGDDVLYKLCLLTRTRMLKHYNVQNYKYYYSNLF